MERGDAPRGLGTGKESSYGASFWCLRAARRRFSSEMRNLRVAVLLVLLDALHADAQRSYSPSHCRVCVSFKEAAEWPLRAANGTTAFCNLP